MPVYDSFNLQNIRKRVFFSSYEFKILIRPAPVYSICNVAEVLKVVKQCMEYGSGQRIIQVGDSQPVSRTRFSKLVPPVEPFQSRSFCLER